MRQNHQCFISFGHKKLDFRNFTEYKAKKSPKIPDFKDFDASRFNTSLMTIINSLSEFDMANLEKEIAVLERKFKRTEITGKTYEWGIYKLKIKYAFAVHENINNNNLAKSVK